MTGCYTDNQPDFTWLLPGESRTFEQYWYPIHGIGEVKCANCEAAVNLEKTDAETVSVGLISTAVRKGLLRGGDELLRTGNASVAWLGRGGRGGGGFR